MTYATLGATLQTSLSLETVFKSDSLWMLFMNKQSILANCVCICEKSSDELSSSLTVICKYNFTKAYKEEFFKIKSYKYPTI